MLKLNQRLQLYRTKMNGVDAYLKRNHVSKDVQRSVKRHFRKSFEEDQINSESHAVLEAMPRYLRRTVLQARRHLSASSPPCFRSPIRLPRRRPPPPPPPSHTPPLRCPSRRQDTHMHMRIPHAACHMPHATCHLRRTSTCAPCAARRSLWASTRR